MCSIAPGLETALREHRIEAVMHFAAFAQVGESVTDPGKYYQNNLIGSISLLEAMRTAGVSRIVFSSTTATYGTPNKIPITEDEPQKPINPYGFTKLAIERALADYAHAFGFAYAALRYFNAAGASPKGDIGEDHAIETHLIPVVLQVALGQRDKVTIFGDDYPTADGTCIRDYIHVDDLAETHLRALDHLQPGKGLALNLGIGRGYSVRQVIDSCRRITGPQNSHRNRPAAGRRSRPSLWPIPRWPSARLNGNPNTPRSTPSSAPPGAGTNRTQKAMASGKPCAKRDQRIN